MGLKGTVCSKMKIQSVLLTSMLFEHQMNFLSPQNIFEHSKTVFQNSPQQSCEKCKKICKKCKNVQHNRSLWKPEIPN